MKPIRILDPILLSFSQDDSINEVEPIRWHKIAVEGSWDGHWQGAFSLTSRMFSEIVQNNQASRVDTPVYYGHADMFGGEGPAAAWIDEMQQRAGDSGSELWARFKYTQHGATDVKAKKYKYISPSIVFNSSDRKTGEYRGARINSVALTNQPFLEELPEVRINSKHFFSTHDSDEDLMNEEQLKKLITSLQLSAESTVDDVLKTVERIVALSKRGLSALSILELTPESTDDEIKNAGVRLLSAKKDSVSVEEFNALKQQLHDRDCQDVIDDAVRQRKLTGKDTPLYKWATEFAKRDLSGFKQWAEAAPEIVPRTIKKPKNNDPDTQLSSNQAKINEQLGLTEENFRKYVNK